MLTALGGVGLVRLADRPAADHHDPLVLRRRQQHAGRLVAQAPVRAGRGPHRSGRVSWARSKMHGWTSRGSSIRPPEKKIRPSASRNRWA